MGNINKSRAARPLQCTTPRQEDRDDKDALAAAGALALPWVSRRVVAGSQDLTVLSCPVLVEETGPSREM